MASSVTLGRIDATTVAELQALRNPDNAAWEALRIDEQDDPEDPWARLYLGTCWNGLHHFLTGKARGGEPPLSLAVGVAAELGHVMKGSTIRYFSALQVGEIAEALVTLNDEGLSQRYDPAHLAGAKLTQFGRGDDDAADLALLLGLFHEIRAFYVDAAARGAGVVQWFCP